MVANLSNIESIFNRCNMDYFNGELPFPQFDLLHSKKTCGYFHYTKGGWFDKTIYNPIISITDYYDFTEKQFIDIMCHEMIHYYLAYVDLDRKCKHGKEFKRMAESLNMTYGLNITSYLDLSQYKKNKVVFRTSNTDTNNNLRFYKEQWGFIFEFNSIGEYIEFLLGRLLGIIIFFGILFLIFWFMK